MTAPSDPRRRITFDANILFYSGDDRDPEKRALSAKLLGAAAERETGILTVQALGEFVNAAVRKALLDRRSAVAVARDWAAAFDVCAADAEAFDLALDWWAEERLPYWDALLVATAAKAGATACVSEDFNDGAVYGGVEIINPFANAAAKRLAAHGLH